MARPRLRALAAAGVASLVVLTSASVALAAPTWRLEQPAPPAGAPFKVPLGGPGDLQFNGPGRGLLTIEGNATVQRGLYFYDGVGWRPLATVCGGSADTARIAWAGPAEFWTVSEPSRPRAGSGTALCHFKDGQVVSSYSTSDSAADPYRQMTSAACNGPDDCWFGGIGSQDPLGQRVGSFHLHWDGRDLRTSYAPQGRGISDMTYFRGRFLESTLVGRRAEDRASKVELAQPEDAGPRVLHAITPEGFRNEPFVIQRRQGDPAGAAELLSVDADADNAWAGGGGAASGPGAPAEGNLARPPVAVRRAGDFWQEVDLDASAFGPNDVITSIAVMPGSGDAMATVSSFADRRSITARARVARIRPDGSVTVTRLPLGGSGRGSGARIACPAVEECWMVTAAGWLFHFSDAIDRPATTDPAFAKVITFRPNEAAEQFVPDAPPVDDSALLAPPPTPPPPTVAPTTPGKPAKAKAVITSVRKPKLDKRLNLTVSFTVLRTARIGLIAYHGKRVVARAELRTLRRGKRSLRLKLSKSRKRYPTRLKFVVRVKGQSSGSNGSGDDTVVSPGPTATDPATDPTTPSDSSAPGGTTTIGRARVQTGGAAAGGAGR